MVLPRLYIIAADALDVFNIPARAAIDAGTRAISTAWDFSVSTAVLVAFVIVLGLLVFGLLAIIKGLLRHAGKRADADSARQDKDIESRIVLAKAVEGHSALVNELVDKVRSVKCLKD